MAHSAISSKDMADLATVIAAVISFGAMIVALIQANIANRAAADAKRQADAAEKQVTAAERQANIADGAAKDAKTQAIAAVDQVSFARQQARSEEIASRNKFAMELAMEWCRLEAPSPISILREWLQNCDEPDIKKIIDEQQVVAQGQFQEIINVFFKGILGASYQPFFKDESDQAIVLTKKDVRLVRHYFARRLNFLELTVASIDSEAKVASKDLVETFFDGIILANSSYLHAANSYPLNWPNLKKFFGQASASGKLNAFQQLK